MRLAILTAGMRLAAGAMCWRGTGSTGAEAMRWQKAPSPPPPPPLQTRPSHRPRIRPALLLLLIPLPPTCRLLLLLLLPLPLLLLLSSNCFAQKLMSARSSLTATFSHWVRLIGPICLTSAAPYRMQRVAACRCASARTQSFHQLGRHA
ncbi:hypothetical protein M433DRAFT_149466, partial [Acidomyces richmondensis BFW]